MDSFTKAANELGVSQGAISQHIKALETRVGFPVFTRSGRGIFITPSGLALINHVRMGLGAIDEIIAYERNKHQSKSLIVSVQPGFAIRWLFPRLMDFHAEFPNIQVSINAITNPTDFSSHQAHAGMDYASDLKKNSDSSAIFTESIFPVCSPDFARIHGVKALSKEFLEKLPNLPLLGDQSPTPQQYGCMWKYWSINSGIKLLENGINRSSQSNITLQLAELGHGIALGRTSLVMDSLKEGKLLQLTEAKLKNPCSYQLLKNPALPEIQSLSIFSDWLTRKAKEIEVFDEEIKCGSRFDR
ncbi:LysR family transcriptional regulator [Vibrio sp. 2-Bac 85]